MGKKEGKNKNKLLLPDDFRLYTLKSQQDLKHRIDYINKHLDKLWEHVSVTNDRLQDLEIQVNLISRFLTTLSIEKLGIKLKTLRKMLKKIEHDAAAESQIRDLETLYQKEFNQRYPHKASDDKNIPYLDEESDSGKTE